MQPLLLHHLARPNVMVASPQWGGTPGEEYEEGKGQKHTSKTGHLVLGVPCLVLLPELDAANPLALQLKCGPKTNCIGITCELVRSRISWPTPHLRNQSLKRWDPIYPKNSFPDSISTQQTLSLNPPANHKVLTYAFARSGDPTNTCCFALALTFSWVFMWFTHLSLNLLHTWYTLVPINCWRLILALGLLFLLEDIIVNSIE